MGIKLYYQLLVHDKNGKLIRKTRRRKAKSWVLQFLQLLEAHIYNTSVSVKDTGDIARDCVSNVVTFRSEAGVGQVTYGIQVGTGTTAVALNDVAIETLIAHGVGAGQLSYGATSKTTTVISGTDVDFILTRTMNNGSGGTINVTEATIACMGFDSASKTFLIAREVFSAVAVTNGQTLTVNWTLKTQL